MSESIFTPRNMADVQDRLRRVLDLPCHCQTGPHEDALHDLAVDDVSWLIAALAERDAQVDRISELLTRTRASHYFAVRQLDEERRALDEAEAALAYSNKAREIMRTEKEHGWREAEKWQDRAEAAEEKLGEL